MPPSSRASPLAFMPLPGSVSLPCAPWTASAPARMSPPKISHMTRTAMASRLQCCLHTRIPSPGHAFRRHESQGSMGQRFLPPLPPKACHDCRPLHPGHACRPRSLHPLHHAPGALNGPPPLPVHLLHKVSNEMPSLPKLGVPSLTHRIIDY